MTQRRTTTEVLDGVDLAGKTILVTGATTGLGYETARSLAGTGASVVITQPHRREGRGRSAEARRRRARRRRHLRGGGVGFAHKRPRVYDAFESEHDRLDVLIANAGVMAAPGDVPRTGSSCTSGPTSSATSSSSAG